MMRLHKISYFIEKNPPISIFFRFPKEIRRKIPINRICGVIILYHELQSVNVQ